MAEINLLQNRLKDTTNVWQRQGNLTLAVFGLILAVIIGATAFLFFLNQSLAAQIDTATTANNDLQQKLTEQQKSLGAAKSFQAQLANLRLLLNNHSYLSPLLDELSKVTYIKSQYVTLDVTEAGKIHLEGRVGSYADLGKLLLGLSTSTKFNNVRLLSAIPSIGATNAYVFSVDMGVATDIFHKK